MAWPGHAISGDVEVTCSLRMVGNPQSVGIRVDVLTYYKRITHPGPPCKLQTGKAKRTGPNLFSAVDLMSTLCRLIRITRFTLVDTNYPTLQACQWNQSGDGIALPL
jgi:hypothetical protein